MALAHASQPSLPATPLRPVKRSTPADLPALTNLYRQNPESAFSADLFPQAVYFGITKEITSSPRAELHALG